MIRSITYHFKVMTRLLIHQRGAAEGIPENFVPLWIGMLPTEKRPSQERLNEIWAITHKDAPAGELRAHYASPFEVDLEDKVYLMKASNRGYRLDWPNWYKEALKAGAITRWDDDRIGHEVAARFGLTEDTHA